MSRFRNKSIEIFGLIIVLFFVCIGGYAQSPKNGSDKLNKAIIKAGHVATGVTKKAIQEGKKVTGKPQNDGYNHQTVTKDCPTGDAYPGSIQSGFSGVYESVSSKGQFVRLHFFVYPYLIPNAYEKLDTRSGKTFKPKDIVVLEETYRGRKAEGKPIRRFYSATAYVSDESILVERGYNLATEEKGILKFYPLSSIDPFSILGKVSHDEFEIQLNRNVKGNFRKVKSYDTAGSLFYPYFDLFFKEIEDRDHRYMPESAKNTHTMAQSGGTKERPYLYAPDFPQFDSKSMEMVLTNLRSTSSGDLYSISPGSLTRVLDDWERGLMAALTNLGYGLHKKLLYLPDLNTIKVFLFSRDREMKTDLFEVKIERQSEKLEYVVTKTESYEEMYEEIMVKARREQQNKDNQNKDRNAVPRDRRMRAP